MDETAGNIEAPEAGQVRPRPVFLSLICLFSFIFFSFITALFFTCIFFSGPIAHVGTLYLPESVFSHGQLLAFFCAGFLLHLLALVGTFLIWSKQKKTGYYLIATPCLIFSLCQAFLPQAAIGTTGAYVAMVFLFGLYFKRLH